MKLIIGNKNYSSWSLRPWLVLTHAGIPFEEHKVSFNAPDFKSHAGPAGKVPVLIDGDLTIWDSLAIVEYLAEKFPDKHLWPADPAARAVARSICAEFHAGFPSLRNNLASNMTARLPGRGWNVAVQREIDRVCALWRDARARFAGDGDRGPFLFGAPTAQQNKEVLACRLACKLLKAREQFPFLDELQIGIATRDLLPEEGPRLHSRKLRSFDELSFR